MDLIKNWIRTQTSVNQIQIRIFSHTSHCRDQGSGKMGLRWAPPLPLNIKCGGGKPMIPPQLICQKIIKKWIYFLLLMFKNFPTLWSLLEVFPTFLPSPKACHISDLPLQVSPYFPLYSSSWTSPTFRCTPTPMHCLVLSISLLTCNVLDLLVMHPSWFLYHQAELLTLCVNR